jgi:tRNA pseudouridine55 synthase
MKVLLIDKPKGITSFDVIRTLRKQLGIKKMGHAGTLDPFATGLMLIGYEEGTKELTLLTKQDKTYIAHVQFGVQTDTGDCTGKVLLRSECVTLSTIEVEQKLAELIGTHEYLPPKYSAIKISGKKLYEYARKGQEVAVPLRSMTVYAAKLISLRQDNNMYIVEVLFDVASGTYIRTLGEELGKLLGYPATLLELRRTRIGSFSIDNAVKLGEHIDI